jgi:hypothetical protein
MPKITQKANSLRPKKENEAEKPKKMTGILFYLVLMIVMFDDFTDLISDASVVLSWLSIFSTLFVTWVLAMYFFWEKVDISSQKVGKRAGQKIALWVAGFIAEAIPFISSLPSGTIVLCVTRFLENNPIVKKLTKNIK